MGRFVTPFFTILLLTSTQAQLKDPSEDLIKANLPRFINGPLRCSCSPSKRSFSNSVLELLEKGLDDTRDHVLQMDPFNETEVEELKLNLSKPMQSCLSKYRAEACFNADRELRKKRNMFYCMYDNKTGKNVYYRGPSNTALFTVAPCDSSNETRSEKKYVEREREPLNQGCVAVEHILKYRLQYRKHLRRKVLCADGFCTTPDHAIIYDGKYTSLKRLCRKTLNCSKKVKLVNNLRVLRNSHVRFNDRIVITAFDYRFPQFFTYVAQITKDIFELVLLLITFVACGAIAIAVHVQLQDGADHAGDERALALRDTEFVDAPASLKKSFQRVVDKAIVMLTPKSKAGASSPFGKTEEDSSASAGPSSGENDATSAPSEALKEGEIVKTDKIVAASEPTESTSEKAGEIVMSEATAEAMVTEDENKEEDDSKQ